MTGINTIEARKHWKDEREYLKKIQYITIETDENGEKYISLLGDEEGNHDIKLTKRSALWLVDSLKEAVEDI